MTATLRTYKVCQYWRLEPSRCSHWDNEQYYCTYFDSGGFAETDAAGCHASIKFPFCNLLGTLKGQCEGYTSTGSDVSICILPDPSRHVCNKATGEKWVQSPTNDVSYGDEGSVIPPTDWTFGAISKYNNGACDSQGMGTKGACTGYSPQKMGFSALSPSSEDSALLTKPGLYSFDYQLPLDYTLLNIRSRISPCYWWSGDPHQYSLDPNTGKVVRADSSDPAAIPVQDVDGNTSYYKSIPLALVAFTSRCTYSPSDAVEPFKSGGQGQEFQYKCNGSSTSCPHYTGNCWRYCNDDKILPGFEVLAEQVLELRWMTRKESWTREVFERVFDDYAISAWRGWQGNIGFTVSPDGSIDYDLPVDKVFIGDYNNFTINYIHSTITPGTSSQDGTPNYPDLVKELKPFTGAPIIRNRFEVVPETGQLGYYEFSDITTSPEVYIYGDVSSTSTTYVINIENEELRSIFPRELYDYDNIFDIYLELSPQQLASFNTRLNEAITQLSFTKPHILRKNTTGADKYTFVVNVNANYGLNRVVVFNKPEDTWLYSTLDFEGLHVGGVVKQTSYTLEGDSGRVWYGPNYQTGTGAAANDNSEVTIVVDPIKHQGFMPEVSYVYNDFDYKKIQEQQSWAVDQGQEQITGYILYEKVIPELEITQSEIIQLNSGHMILDINNSSLTSAIFAWLPTSIKIIYNDANSEDDKTVVECAIVAHNDTQMLAPNQVIIYPNDMTNFRSFCIHSGDKFVLEDVSIFYKNSFGQEPPTISGTEVLNAISLYNDNVYASGEELSGTGYQYSLRKSDSTVHFSAVLKNRAGREFLTAKSSLLYWVKQPYIPDVEIKYEWIGNYDLYECSPRCSCVGNFSEVYLAQDMTDTWFSMPPGVRVPHKEFLEPYCGDHDKIEKYKGELGGFLGANNKVGAMWYPYIQCDGYQSYANITNQGASALEIMTDFIEEATNGGYLHGQHDLRMLGPDRYMAWEGNYCYMPSNCSCGRSHFNGRKVEGHTSRFSGYAQYRSAVSFSQMSAWIQEIGAIRRLEERTIRVGQDDTRNPQWPGFGNSARPFLRSFRSNHRLQYYHKNTFGPGSDDTSARSWKYMPAYNEFSFADFSSRSSKIFDDYSNHLGSNSINTLGMVLFNTLDNSSFAETIDTTNVLSYNEVFRNHGGYDDILYPKAQDNYARSSMPWLDFRDNIQWAWQLPWHSINRDIAIDGVPQTLMGCLVLSYPSYKYNYTLGETRACPAEGIHQLSLTAPVMDVSGAYTDNPKFQLDNGAVREFDFFTGWKTTSEPYLTMYASEDSDTYFQDISLTTKADVDDRYTVYYGKDGEGNEINYYGFEGLPATIYQEFYYTLPQTSWPLVVTTADQPGDYTVNVTTTNLEGTDAVSFIFDFFNDVAGEYITQRINKAILSCQFGLRPGEYYEDENGDQQRYLDIQAHIPAITVYALVDEGIHYTELASSGMILSKPTDGYGIKKTTLNIKLPPSYMWYGATSLLITLRAVPTDEELLFSGYDSTTFSDMDIPSSRVVNKIILNDINLYSSKLANGTEYLDTFERKYRVSRAGEASSQPQGSGDDKLLHAPGYETSTVYQRDNRDGIRRSKAINKYDEYELPTTLANSAGQKDYISKCRSRLIGDIILEQTPIEASTPADIQQAETKVPDMYNNKALANNPTEIRARHFTLPDIEAYMEANDFSFFYGDSLELVMKNTFVAKLTDLVPQPPYSPTGHYYMPSTYHDTYCKPRGESFEYIYAQVDANADVTEIHNMLYSGVEDPAERGSDYYATDVAVINTLGEGSATARGLGEIYYPPSQQDIPGYHHIVNERTKYAQGTTLYQTRSLQATWLYHAVYPAYFTRYTQAEAFADELTTLSMPPTMALTPLLDFSGGPKHENAYSSVNVSRLAGGTFIRNWRTKEVSAF